MLKEKTEPETVQGESRFMADTPAVRRAMTLATDPDRIAADLWAGLIQPDLRLVVVFTSAPCDMDVLAQALQSRFGDVPVVGCTSAGEIGDSGYLDGGTVGVSLGADDFAAAPVLIRRLHDFTVAAGHEVVRAAQQSLWNQFPQCERGQMFAFTLIDGLSGCEEAVVSALHAAMGEIPLCGGSAGDCMRFSSTQIFYQGQALTDCALFILVGTALPFRAFKTEHFIAGEEKAVITESDPMGRIVTEINAEPAALEYARVVGLEIDESALTPMIFANHPMVVRVGGTNFVRSIQKVNDDGSLTFFCAIDRGIVLRAAHGVDLVENLAELFADLRADLGPPILTLGFDCILRGLEMDEKGIRSDVGRLMADNRVTGFATYGEQYRAMHVNQTFTGIAIGHKRARS